MCVRKKWPAHPTFFVGVIFCLFAFEIGAAEEYEIDPQLASSQMLIDYACGPNSLYVVQRLLGLSYDLDTVSKLTGPNPFETSMLGLKKAAEQMGLKAVAMHLSCGKLKSFLKKGSVFAIAHNSSQNHFFVICGFNDVEFIVVDVPHKPLMLSEDRLKRFWKGDILLISDSEEVFRNPPWIKHIVYLVVICSVPLAIFAFFIVWKWKRAAAQRAR